MNSGKVYALLQKKFKITTVADNTVRNYVNELRDRYHIPKETNSREYGTVEELPMGKQMQVDFGVMFVPTESGSRKKLYAAGFVLSHSRFKYVEWIDRPL